MLAKLKIKNKIVVFFSIIYSIYLVIILIYTYNNNIRILTESLKNKMTQSYYQLSYSVVDDIRTDNIYQINQKINTIASKSEEIAYIIIYDNEKNIIGKSIKDVPEKLVTFDENRDSFMEYNSSKGHLIDYISKIEDVDIGYVRLGFYTKNIYEKTYKEFINIAFLNTIVFLILLIVAYNIAKLVEKPISDLTDVVNDIAIHDNYSKKVFKNNYSRDFYVLIDSINKMIISNEENKKVNNRLLNKVFDVQEEERKVLSRELHDEVSQSLASLLFLLTNLIDKEVDTLKKDRLILIKDELDKSLSNIRNIAVNLRPPVLEEHGLKAALNKFIDEYMLMYGIEVTFETNIEEINNDNFNITIYRIIQECLTNIKKHANATRVNVRFFMNSDYIVLKISDNGIGLSYDRILEARSEGRLGVYGIKERVLDFSGEFSVEKSEKYSTIIKCKFKKINIVKE